MFSKKGHKRNQKIAKQWLWYHPHVIWYYFIDNNLSIYFGEDKTEAVFAGTKEKLNENGKRYITYGWIENKLVLGISTRDLTPPTTISLILNLVSFIEKINTTQYFNLVTKMEKKTSTTQHKYGCSCF